MVGVYRVKTVERTPEEMAAYLEAWLEEANDDAAFIAKALGDIARAKGMSQVARDAGLSRESLYKALSGERSPSFDTILKVIRALGMKLHTEAVLVASSTAQSGEGMGRFFLLPSPPDTIPCLQVRTAKLQTELEALKSDLRKQRPPFDAYFV
jgi:probable addiction module antidote protein